MCSFLQLIGDKWGKSGTRGWCVIPRNDPLVLYVYAAPQVTPRPAPLQASALSQHGAGAGAVQAGGDTEYRWPKISNEETEAQGMWFPPVTGLVAFKAGPRIWVTTALPSGTANFPLPGRPPASPPCLVSVWGVTGGCVAVTFKGLGQRAEGGTLFPPRILGLTPPSPCWATR